ncbi:hypothetical protein [Siminovitchia terrae]|nr:hypothetical protein [Siminovitchia terrae]
MRKVTKEVMQNNSLVGQETVAASQNDFTGEEGKKQLACSALV